MGFGQPLVGILSGPTVIRVDAPAVPARRRYCLRCDVPFRSELRCPGCGGPGISDRDGIEASRFLPAPLW